MHFITIFAKIVVVQQTQTVWHKAGGVPAESPIGLSSVRTRASFSVPPPARQAANRYLPFKNDIQNKMIRLKNILTILLFCLTLISYGQTQKVDTKSENYKVLAKLVSFEGGDKVHFAKWRIIKKLSDTLIMSDTIIVGYYNYKQPDNNIDTALLTIKKYNGQTSMKNYFICPDYDGTNNIQKAKVEYIDFDYWEGCEIGNGNCKPLIFTRTRNEEKLFLIMPCGGTETTITISGQNFSENLHLYYNNCPPYLELTNLTDGQYFANMIACGLGGSVTFNLITTE